MLCVYFDTTKLHSRALFDCFTGCSKDDAYGPDPTKFQYVVQEFGEPNIYIVSALQIRYGWYNGLSHKSQFANLGFICCDDWHKQIIIFYEKSWFKTRLRKWHKVCFCSLFVQSKERPVHTREVQAVPEATLQCRGGRNMESEGRQCLFRKMSRLYQSIFYYLGYWNVVWISQIKKAQHF